MVSYNIIITFISNRKEVKNLNSLTVSDRAMVEVILDGATIRMQFFPFYPWFEALPWGCFGEIWQKAAENNSQQAQYCAIFGETDRNMVKNMVANIE